MLVIPQKGRWLTQHNLGTVGTTTPGTTVTTGATSSTKGTAVEIFASTNFDACLLEIATSGYAGSSADSRATLDILIGAATESILIADLIVGNSGAFGGADAGPNRFFFPLFIPSGSRIAAQAAGARTTTAMQVMLKLHGGLISPPFRVGGKVTTYGIGTVPAGTAITPGASGAEGAWTQISASSSRDHFAFYPSIQCSDTTMNTRCLFVDMGIGAATEEMIGESYVYVSGANESLVGPELSIWPTFADVPSGTRLVMRASNSGLNDSGYEVAMYGVS